MLDTNVTGTRGKHLTISVTNNHILVGRKGDLPLLDGPLHKECRPDDLIWTIDDDDDDTGRVITLELPKKNQMEWWRTIVQGDEEIDTSKVFMSEPVQICSSFVFFIFYMHCATVLVHIGRWNLRTPNLMTSIETQGKRLKK